MLFFQLTLCLRYLSDFGTSLEMFSEKRFRKFFLGSDLSRLRSSGSLTSVSSGDVVENVAAALEDMLELREKLMSVLILESRLLLRLMLVMMSLTTISSCFEAFFLHPDALDDTEDTEEGVVDDVTDEEAEAELEGAGAPSGGVSLPSRHLDRKIIALNSGNSSLPSLSRSHR